MHHRGITITTSKAELAIFITTLLSSSHFWFLIFYKFAAIIKAGMAGDEEYDEKLDSTHLHVFEQPVSAAAIAILINDR